MTGGPSGPSTPGPGGPARPRGGPTTGGRQGLDLGVAFDGWDQWWEFNRDRFLQLRREIWRRDAATGDADIALGQGLRRARATSVQPTRRDVDKRIIPAIESILDEAPRSTDLMASAAISLARLGRAKGFRARMHKLLQTRSMPEKEIAVLALGIDGRESVLADLIALAADHRDGRKLVQTPTGVPVRLRAFATYSCGLVAEQNADTRIKRRVFFAMRHMLDDSYVSRRDLHVAAIHALRLLAPDLETEAGRALRDDCVHYMLGVLDRSRPLSDIARSHVLLAMARLVGRTDPSTRVARRAMRAFAPLDAPAVRQSALLALGEVGVRQDTEMLKVLFRACAKDKNRQARSFATIALGQIGGSEVIRFLRRRLQRARKYEKPWVSIALALASRGIGESTLASIRQDVIAAYDAVRAPQFSSGIAIALGLLGARDAEQALTTRMLEIRAQGKSAGYHAVALGLMDAGAAAPDIRRLFEETKHDQDLLAKTATALALLGDKSIVTDLTRRLRQGVGSIATRHAMTRALGLVGDRHAIGDLITFISNRKEKALPRAFATVALGMIGDADVMPWNERMAANVNYRAVVDTLSGASGVLDIL